MSDSPLNKNIYESEEIRLVEIFDTIKDYFWYIVRKWWLLLLIVLLSALAGFGYTKWTDDFYRTTGSYMIDNDSGSNSISTTINAIAGSFGFGGKSGELSNEVLHGIMKSKRVIKKSLLTKVEYEGDSTQLGNIYLEYYPDFRENVSSPEFVFTSLTIDDINPEDDRVLNFLHPILLEEHVQVVFEEDNGLNKLTVESLSRDFSHDMCQLILRYSIDFFFESKTTKERKNLISATKQVDSIKQVLFGKENRLAQVSDESNYRIKAKAYLEEGRLMRDIQLLSEMYGQSFASLEVAKMSLTEKQPVIQLVDKPEFTTELVYDKLFVNLAIFIFLGGFFGFTGIIVRKFFHDLMEDERAKLSA